MFTLCVRVCMYVRVCTGVCACVYMCVCVCVRVWVRVHIGIIQYVRRNLNPRGGRFYHLTTNVVNTGRVVKRVRVCSLYRHIHNYIFERVRPSSNQEVVMFCDWSLRYLVTRR